MAIGAIRLIGLAFGALILGVLSASFAFGQFGPGHPGIGMQGPKAWLGRADTNKDGAISLEEIKAARDGRFVEFDLNKDGTVDAEEVETAVRERVERMTKRIVRRFDKDRDGTITRDEFNRFAEERFTWLDLNDDGKVTKDEMPRFMRHKVWRN
ncbi:MAG: EF-hand domain-containing protein [Hyphomicrobiaceae bacterium]|nr:EF-hand domain-containing protein [Hyphomicrobiaceae bacterium]